MTDRFVKDRHFAPNNDGWELALRRCVAPDSLDVGRRPLLIIPGYGMNSYIFDYHPNGPSMMESLATQGFEVWTVDLRNQGRARNVGGHDEYQLGDIGCTDVPAALDYILDHTATNGDRVDGLGCSLGGSYLFIYASCVPGHRLGALVAMGAPLRWLDVHPAIRFAFGSPWLAGQLRMKYTRELAGFLFPLALRVPQLLRMYMYTDHVDTSRPDLLVETVDDPNRHLNRELALWMKRGDLVIRGLNVTEAFGKVDLPLLAVVADADGIVPEATAMSAYEHSGARRKDVLRIGGPGRHYAHANLFIGNHAQDDVFRPVGSWLAGLYPASRR